MHVYFVCNVQPMSLADRVGLTAAEDTLDALPQTPQDQAAEDATSAQTCSSNDPHEVRPTCCCALVASWFLGPVSSHAYSLAGCQCAAQEAEDQGHWEGASPRAYLWGAGPSVCPAPAAHAQPAPGWVAPALSCAAASHSCPPGWTGTACRCTYRWACLHPLQSSVAQQCLSSPQFYLSSPTAP